MNAPVDLTNVRIETDRLVLRPWRESDLEDFFAYASVDGVGQMAGWNPHKSKEESREILGRFIEGRKTFALELKENGVNEIVKEIHFQDTTVHVNQKIQQLYYQLLDQV